MICVKSASYNFPTGPRQHSRRKKAAARAVMMQATPALHHVFITCMQWRNAMNKPSVKSLSSLTLAALAAAAMLSACGKNETPAAPAAGSAADAVKQE